MRLFLILIAILALACQPKKPTTEPGTAPPDTVSSLEIAKTPPVPEEKAELAADNPDLGINDHFICYKGDGGSSLEIAIAFNKMGRAHSVQYKGQDEVMQLRFEEEETSAEGSTPITRTTYTELYHGKANGTYVLTHSGNWHYAKYTRGKDGKVFNFTIDHENMGEDGGYKKTPCFETEEDFVTDYFICYEGDNESGLAISVNFNKAGRALGVMYRGQEELMKLKFVKEEWNTKGSYPTIKTTYREMLEGKENGTYVLTHSGNWDYARYTRGRDGKVFNFTIDHDMLEGDEYPKNPCYYVEEGH